MIYVQGKHAQMLPMKRVRMTVWVHPDRPRGVAYRDCGEGSRWLRDAGYKQRVQWVVAPYAAVEGVEQ